ncbi:MAG TPA: DHA2 family efflux MFS transporter permease subunit [Casimicrobiaceae bacterium]|nr:DHA2 family efflux MFS transporter permease subunit [Casimicrobiaceae bacterium]
MDRPAQGSRFFVVMAVMAATVIQVLDTTIVNVALPHMAGELGASLDQISWVLTSYIVASSIVMPMTGYLTDRLGRRKYLLISIAGFVIASALCGIATSLTEIVLFRLLQGIFGASLVPLSQAIMVDIYPVRDRGKAMAIWGMGVMVAPILGPTLGGWLTETVNWRWNFYINVPVGVLSFLLAARHVPDTPVKERGMDWWGLAFLAMFIGGLQYLLDRGQQEDWFDASSIRWSAAILAAGLGLFVAHSVMSKRHTLINLHVFADRNFTAASIVGASMGLSLFGGLLLQPVLFENILQYPTFDTGLAMMPRGFGSLLAMLIVGRVIGRVGAKPLIYFGIVCGTIGAWMMTNVSFNTTSTSLIVPLVLQGIGIGCVFVPLSAIAFATLPKTLTAEAAGVYNLIRSIGSSIGISIVSVSLARGAQASWGVLRGYVDPYRPELQQYLDPLHLKAQGQGLAIIAQQAAVQAQMLGLLRAFWVIVLSFLVMIPLVMLLKPGRPGQGPPAAAMAE